VIAPIYEEKFLETIYGFRPGKSTHDALKTRRMLMDAGYVWMVDMDLEKFFDTVNQSDLMQLLGEEIRDEWVLCLIHKYLKVNQEKTVVTHATKIKFLGYGFYENQKGYQFCVHKKNVDKLKDRIRKLTDRRNVYSYEARKAEIRKYVVKWAN